MNSEETKTNMEHISLPEKAKIIVVDDEPIVLKLIGDTLTKEGHEIYTAERGSEALKIIAKSPLDMLITDIKMPEMGGIQLIEEAKGIIPEILIIVITGYPEFNSALKSLKKRVYDYIVKPIDPDVVVATVNRAWERQRLAVKNRQLILNLKQANEELQAAKADAEGIITNFLDTLIVTDREAKIETVNPETCHLLGYTVEELIGQPVRDIFAEEEKEVRRVFQFFREHENGKAKALRPQDTIRNRELTYRTKGGRLIPMSFNASVITDESGNIMGVVAGAKDITDLKLKEAEIRRERNFSENIIATIPDSLLVVDKDLRVKKANLSFHNVFGLEPEKVIGARITDILGDEDGRLSAELTGLFGTEAMLEDFEFHYEQGKPGERACPPCESARRGGRVLNIRARNIIIAEEEEEELIVMSDITRHKRADEAVQLLNAELERSNRDLLDFTYTVSHDLQEPLRKIHIFGEFLKEDCGDLLPPEGRDHLHRMQDAALRMKGLIQHLLTLSRVGTQGKEFVPVEPRRVIDSVLEDFSEHINKTGAEVDVQQDLPTVVADDLQLGELFQNLIGNALKFMPEGRTPKIAVSARVQGGEAIFSVADNGIGIAEEYWEKIFGVFQRLHRKEQYEGVGIGLALCQKIVQRHGGKIWVESEVGKRSTFYFTLKRISETKEEQA